MLASVPCPSVAPAVAPPSLSVLGEQYRRHALGVRSVSADTVAEELLYLTRLFDHFGPPGTPTELFAALDPDAVSRFLVRYAEEHTPGSRRWMQVSLRSFLRFAYQCGYLERDLSGIVPAVRARRLGHVPRGLPAECIAALNTRLEPDTPAGLRDTAMICLLSTYGVRGVQIRRLRLDQLDCVGSRIHFPAAKGGRPIVQHLTPEAGNRLADYLAHGRPDSPCPEVFLTAHEPYRPLPCASHLSAVLRRRMEQLGLTLPEGVSHGTHGFRHAFATRLTGRVPFKDIADLLGHRDPSSTLIYGKVDLDALREAALPWPGGGR